MNQTQEKLKEWFVQEKRNLPWRVNLTPYRVWISEVMLQQTRAEVVIDYFEKWMKRFPTIQALAHSSVEEVIKTWEGLGYYSRARNLHRAAKWIVENNQGIFPSDEKGLRSIKGIGPYTAGAILSFAFHQKAAAIDGNVMRVITRLYHITTSIGLSSTQKEIRKIVEEFISENSSWLLMEGLIELGATICKKIPLCQNCPLNQDCLSFKKGEEKDLPLTAKTHKPIVLHRYVPIVYYGEEYLVQQHQGKKIMADLYEFPYFSNENAIEGFFSFELTYKGSFTKAMHTFTKYRAHLFPTLWEASEKKEISGFKWVSLSLLNTLPFSSGHRRILNQLLERHAISTY